MVQAYLHPIYTYSCYIHVLDYTIMHFDSLKWLIIPSLVCATPSWSPAVSRTRDIDRSRMCVAPLHSAMAWTCLHGGICNTKNKKHIIALVGVVGAQFHESLCFQVWIKYNIFQQKKYTFIHLRIQRYQLVCTVISRVNRNLLVCHIFPWNLHVCFKIIYNVKKHEENIHSKMW